MGKFQLGDVVMLKSGGPKMTAGKYSEVDGTSISCEWFLDGRNQYLNFNEAALKLVERETEEKEKSIFA